MKKLKYYTKGGWVYQVGLEESLSLNFLFRDKTTETTRGEGHLAQSSGSIIRVGESRQCDLKANAHSTSILHWNQRTMNAGCSTLSPHVGSRISARDLVSTRVGSDPHRSCNQENYQEIPDSLELTAIPDHHKWPLTKRDQYEERKRPKGIFGSRVWCSLVGSTCL